MPADRFGKSVVRDYSLTYVIYDFHEAAMDRDFERSEVADEELSNVFELFSDKLSRQK